MVMGSVVVFILVFGAAMAYVGWPLITPLLAEDAPSAREEKRKELVEEKERLLQALRDLDHDRRTGKLEDDDYKTLGDRLKADAANVLRELDQNDGRRGDAPSAPVQTELPDTKPAKPAAPPASPASPAVFDTPTIRVTHKELQEQAAKAGVAMKFCTKCGRQAKAGDDKFCGRCGAELPSD